MATSIFSRGHEQFLGNEAERYLKEKFAKSNAKVKSKAKERSRIAPTRPSTKLAGPRGLAAEELDEAERELLGLSKGAPSQAPTALVPSDVNAKPLSVDAGPAQRLAAEGTAQCCRRRCPENHPLSCYVIGHSAALCDQCDALQKPGQIVFGCSTCDSELCATCAVDSASAQEAAEHLELIARVTRLYSAKGNAPDTRFVATPSGAVLDTKPPQEPSKTPSITDASSAGFARRKQAAEIDESAWKQSAKQGYANGQTPGERKFEDLLGKLLAEQEELIQQRRMDHLETTTSCSPHMRNPCPEASDVRGGQEEATNLMDENAARERPAWAVSGVSPTRVPAPPMERTFDLTLTLTGDFVDELIRGYSQPWFQELVSRCGQECGSDRQKFLHQLCDVAFEVQKPILENWGFEGNEQGLYDMTSILREHSCDGPAWLREKISSCMQLLFAGKETLIRTGDRAASPR
mmetsp:Transcript_33756/g.78011  ORF Transcript_33756/g.78011 Transcript_33756/m.78011 type:complete len:463 (+) Transcript_33756:28-1416(+)